MRSSRAVVLSLVVLGWLMKGPFAGASIGLVDVRADVDQKTTTFFLHLDAAAHFSPVWVSPRIYALDLTGVTTTRSSKPQPLDSPLISNYRLLTYSGAAGAPHLLLELELKEDAKIEAVQVSGGVTVTARASSERDAATIVQEKHSDVPAAAVVSSKSAVVPRGNTIREIQVAKLEGSSALEVNIVGNGSLEYKTLQLSNPERLVLDMPNVSNRIRERQLPVNAAPLRDVRVGQLSKSPLVSRVVMDLDSKTSFHVRPQPNSLVVTLGDEGLAGSDNKATASAPLTPQVESKRMGTGATQSLSQTEQPSRQNDNQEVSTTPQSATSAENTSTEKPLAGSESTSGGSSKSDVSGAGSARNEISVPQVALNSLPPLSAPMEQKESSAALSQSPAVTKLQPTATRVGLPSERPPQAERIAAKQDSRILLAQQIVPPPAATPSPSGPSAAACQGPPYTGEPISVNLKDVDLKDFFRLIHEISSLNVVLDPDVSGTLTIVLDEIPWDHAMGIVLKNNHLEAQCEGNVVRIAKSTTIEAEDKQVSERATAQELAQPLAPQSRSLNYAQAIDLVATLKRLLSPRGDIIADARTNTIIVRDTPDRIMQIDNLLPILDRKTQQVEIEARVVSASRSFARDIGIQLAASGLAGNVTLGGTGLVGVSPSNRSATPPLFSTSQPTQFPVNQSGPVSGLGQVAQPLITNLGAQGPTSGFSLLLTSGSNFALDAIITAAESKGIGKLLSRPKIITQNNVEATVKQGVRIPIQTTINNTVSVQYVDVVLRLTVTPQITAEGTVFLKTDIENTSIDPGIATIPGQFGLDTQAATTRVLVSNGGTVFFGGVVQTVNRINQSEVPLLGSMPLIGNLFKHKSITSTSNELLFFITPKIVQS